MSKDVKFIPALGYKRSAGKTLWELVEQAIIGFGCETRQDIGHRVWMKFCLIILPADLEAVLDEAVNKGKLVRVGTHYWHPTDYKAR